MKRKWQFFVNTWIGANTYGIRFNGARRNGKGRWLTGDELPEKVRKFFCIEKQTSSWTMPDYKTLQELREKAHNCTFQKRNPCYGWCAIDEPKLTLPPKIEVDLAKLRETLREMNEGRNMKRYGKEWVGRFFCGEREFLLTPATKKWVKTHRCTCGKRHRVTWKEEDRCYGGCFDILSFGWKDADLDPEGCTGIDKLLDIQGKRVAFQVSGHKVLCDPTYEFEYQFFVLRGCSLHRLRLRVRRQLGRRRLVSILY
jgi:hypothetical protein